MLGLDCQDNGYRARLGPIMGMLANASEMHDSPCRPTTFQQEGVRMRSVPGLDHRTLFGAAATVAAAISLLAMPVPAGPSDAPFVAQINAATTKMMAAMMIKPSGDVDEDFVASMVPHHQGAIDMAEAELRYGHNETIRRIAQEIIVTQQQEIAAMRLALREPLPPSVPAPDQTPQ
jgi:Domain of unknown function (DUF305)